MKIILKNAWTRFVIYLNTTPASSREHTALSGYAGLCDMNQGRDQRH